MTTTTVNSKQCQCSRVDRKILVPWLYYRVQDLGCKITSAFRGWVMGLRPHRRMTEKLNTAVYSGLLIYTMHNKFSNCFVWVSPSTSDHEFHLLSWRYTRRSSDKIFHLKKYRITKRSGRAKVTWVFLIIGGSRNHFQTIVWSLKTKKA